MAPVWAIFCCRSHVEESLIRLRFAGIYFCERHKAPAVEFGLIRDRIFDAADTRRTGSANGARIILRAAADSGKEGVVYMSE